MKNALGSLALSVLTASLFLSGCSSPEAEPSAPEVTEEATSEADVVKTEDSEPPAMQSPVKPASGDPIRGPGGLEEKCLARVAEETGAKVNGTNHIEESEAAVEVYVNVDGAQAPWKCLGTKDGAISEVSYTGSEGYL